MKFRRSLYPKRFLRFLVLSLIGSLLLIFYVSKLDTKVQLKDGDFFNRLPSILEKYGADSKEFIHSLQNRAKSLQKRPNEALQHSKGDKDSATRDTVQALLDDSTTSEVSTSTERYINEHQDNNDTSENTSTEKTTSSNDKIALEVEKTEYWDQLYKNNRNKEEPKEPASENMKGSASQQGSKSNVGYPLENPKAVQQEEETPQVVEDNETNSPLAILLEASKLQAKYGDCDNLPNQVFDLPENIKQTWCQMKGVQKDYVQWGIDKLEEMQGLTARKGIGVSE